MTDKELIKRILGISYPTGAALWKAKMYDVADAFARAILTLCADINMAELKAQGETRTAGNPTPDQIKKAIATIKRELPFDDHPELHEELDRIAKNQTSEDN